MSIETDVWTYLSGKAAVTALFGTRLYPGSQAPPGDPWPRAEITDLGELPPERIGGPISAQTWLPTYRFQVTAFCEGKASADAAGDVLRDALDPAVLVLTGTGAPVALCPCRDLYVKKVDPTGALSENQKKVWQAVLHYRLLAQRNLPA